MQPEERQVIRDVANWLDEHRNFMSRDVIGGYASLIDALDSLLPAGYRQAPDVLTGPFGQGYSTDEGQEEEEGEGA